MTLEDKICQAIDIIVDSKVQKAGYDKTIQAVVKSCEDSAVGKYKVSYQDSTFLAYSQNPETRYAQGTLVYILVPKNDMKQKKTILGTVDKLGNEIIPNIDPEDIYDVIGGNGVTLSKTYKLSSYFQNNTESAYVKVLYNSKNPELQELKLDVFALNQYLKQSSSLLCGAKFKTTIPYEQQTKGNFGVVFELEFLDNATAAPVTRYYTIDINNMTGNPYSLEKGKRQFEIFTIDGANFKQINSISVFVKDFPNSKSLDEIDKQNLYDIEISDFEISGVSVLDPNSLQGCTVNILTPQGTFFSAESLDDAKLRLEAQVRIKGKIIPSVRELPFYWFVEDMRVDEKSKYYNKNGGKGWRCLNSPVSAPMKNIYDVKVKDMLAKRLRYKCVVLYDNVAYNDTIEIQNFRSAFDITIESDGGTDFYYDIGKPNLTCLVNGKSLPDSYNYIWAKEEIDGSSVILEETISLNQEYQEAKASLKELEDKILNGELYPLASEAELKKRQQRVKNAEKQMINKNQILFLSVNEIVKVGIYKCSVYNGNEYLGTSSIRLTNSLKNTENYTLIINNATQLFQYDEFGVSPASKSLPRPQVLKPLTFSIFDNQGKEFDEDILRRCEITWKVPLKNSMLFNIRSNGENLAPDAKLEYQYIKQATEIVYDIQNKYYHNFVNNNIELQVKYKEVCLTSRTNFSFVKQGDSGTNGTQYTARLIPHVTRGDIPPLYPTIIIAGHEKKWNFNLPNGSGKPFDVGNQEHAPLRVKLYKNGEEIFYGNRSGRDSEGNWVSLRWEILKNNYGKKITERTNLTIDEHNGIISFVEGEIKNSANIVVCYIDYGDPEREKRKRMYISMPIIISKVKSSSYKMFLKEPTGFREVVYTSDGTRPQYSSDLPFEIEIFKNIGGYDELISLSSISGTELIKNYNWSICGNYYDVADSSTEAAKRWKDSNLLTILSKRDYTFKGIVAEKRNLPKDGNVDNDVYYVLSQKRLYLWKRGEWELPNLDNPNQCSVKPSTLYNGLSINNALICETSVGTIYIPIHLMLNRYGLNFLNDWNGNSIEINEDGGYILAPQIGAGRKHSDNTFTGMVMGEALEPGRTKSDIGLIAFSKGERSLFLNAEDGSAIFGKRSGRIVIDTATDKLMLYSGNFWKSYSEDGKPANYLSTNENHQGLLIDLTTPRIAFGNGNFSVDSDGHLIAKGGGSIAGWRIDNTSLYNLVNGKKTAFISSTNLPASFYFIENGNFVKKSVPNSRLALGYNKEWDYHKFIVNEDGQLFAQGGKFAGGTIELYSDTTGNTPYGDGGLYVGDDNGFGLLAKYGSLSFYRSPSQLVKWENRYKISEIGVTVAGFGQHYFSFSVNSDFSMGDAHSSAEGFRFGENLVNQATVISSQEDLQMTDMEYEEYLSKKTILLGLEKAAEKEFLLMSSSDFKISSNKTTVNSKETLFNSNKVSIDKSLHTNVSHTLNSGGKDFLGLIHYGGIAEAFGAAGLGVHIATQDSIKVIAPSLYSLRADGTSRYGSVEFYALHYEASGTNCFLNMRDSEGNPIGTIRFKGDHTMWVWTGGNNWKEVWLK